MASGRESFVGAKACGACHATQTSAWAGSHHQLAMQAAGETTVLGNFNHATFANNSTISVFHKSGPHFMVRTDGPDRRLHDYEIAFTFGVYPLQQYLIAMPGGRLQALGIAWDCRPRDNGGQRWFFLYPTQQIAGGDPLHWTGIDQNWNYMCADCHSTNVRKNYDPKNRDYHTKYAEIDVACEACHGPGSDHVVWAKKEAGRKALDATKGLTVALDDRRGAVWSIDPATGNGRRNTPRLSEREIQTCARCHSRRGAIHEDYVHGQPVGDDYRVALLDPDLYFPDGQIKGEVYEYGSFIQSKMFHAGVTCSDCHDPHSLKLRAEGNGVCLQCHSGTKYDSSRHHFHKVQSAGGRCVACHMPTRTYMVIHQRHDHSLRIPRPDLTMRMGTPNSCNQCHADKSARWAAETIGKWYGHTPEGFQRYAEAIRSGEEGAPDAQLALTALATNRDQPAIARATALGLLGPYLSSSTVNVIHEGVGDNSPLVRRATASALSNSDRSVDLASLAPLLSDPVRSVRIETGEMLADVDPHQVGKQTISALDGAVAEYIAAQQLNADRPEAHLNLASLYTKEKKVQLAEDELKESLALDPTFAPAAVNLADLYRESGRESEGVAVLRASLRRAPNAPALLHALGLAMVRRHDRAQALALLGAASRGEPTNARYAYVYAIALNDSGKSNEAIAILENSVKQHPYDRDSLAALVNLLAQADHTDQARAYAQRLYQLEPNNPQLRQMLSAPATHEAR